MLSAADLPHTSSSAERSRSLEMWMWAGARCQAAGDVVAGSKAGRSRAECLQAGSLNEPNLKVQINTQLQKATLKPAATAPVLAILAKHGAIKGDDDPWRRRTALAAAAGAGRVPQPLEHAGDGCRRQAGTACADQAADLLDLRRHG